MSKNNPQNEHESQQGELLLVTDIVLNAENPREQTEEDMHKTRQSLLVFPKMLWHRKVTLNDKVKRMVLGGNMRTRALLWIKDASREDLLEELEQQKKYQNMTAYEQEQLLEFWLKWQQKPVVPVDYTPEFTEEEQQEFVIKDNLSFGNWDWDMLANQWDESLLEDFGLDVWQPEKEQGNSNGSSGEQHGKLEDKFVVPPFTILDTRQGYWRERKAVWRQLIQDFGESRENKLADGATNVMATINSGVSLLDPVMAELVCRWFGIGGGKAFDCFAGDTVFGYVAATLGMSFTGIELREEQASLNNERVQGMSARYICDDGQNVAKHIAKESQDLLFSCPPYYDLEVYSDLPNDASNQGTYEEFLQILRNAFNGAVQCLKQNRFAVVVVGDIRSKEGFYYDFVGDIKRMFKEAGMPLYNECIIVEPIGTLPQRVARYMRNRKVGKCHQNVLVFYKGNPAEIANNYPAIEYDPAELVELAGESTTNESEEGTTSANDIGGGNELKQLLEFRKQFITQRFIMYLPVPKLQQALEAGNIHIERNEQGEIVGYLWLENLKKKPISRIEEICSVQRGLGTQLIQRAIEQRIHPTLELKVVEYNSNAITFYQHRGFVEVSREHGKKVNNITMHYGGKDLER